MFARSFRGFPKLHKVWEPSGGQVAVGDGRERDPVERRTLEKEERLPSAKPPWRTGTELRGNSNPSLGSLKV